jgi:hypothetical protein
VGSTIREAAALEDAPSDATALLVETLDAMQHARHQDHAAANKVLD